MAIKLKTTRWKIGKYEIVGDIALVDMYIYDLKIKSLSDIKHLILKDVYTIETVAVPITNKDLVDDDMKKHIYEQIITGSENNKFFKAKKS